MVRTGVLFILFFGVLVSSERASAQVSRASDVKQNRSFVYHGRIVRPDGSLPTGSMSVTLKIYSPEPALCLLWGENQTVEVRAGTFVAELGYNQNRIVGPSGGAAADFGQVFINNSALTIPASKCEIGNSYTPTMSDDRLLSAAFNDSGKIVEIANMPIKSVPYALQAEQVSGYGISNLMKISGSGNGVTFTPAEVVSLKDLLGADLNWDFKTRKLTNVADPVVPSDAANRGWVLAQISSQITGAAVTSVGFSAPSIFNVAGSPVSTTGTISLSLATQNANKVFAGPASGGDAQPAFRALAPADIPALDASKITSGTFTTTQMPNLDASKITSGTLPVGRLPAMTGGDVTSSAGSDLLTVVSVGGQTAANVAAGAVLANTATHLNTPSAIVKRDASGDFAAGAITATSVSGNGSGLTSLNASNLSSGTVPGTRMPAITGGDVSSTAGSVALTVDSVGGQSAANVAAAAALANSATASNTANAIVKRDASGNFAAGAITATSVSGNGSGLTSLNASNLSSGTVPGARLPALTGGDVSSTAGSVALTVDSVGGQTAANVAAGAVLANAATATNTASAIVKRDASGNFAAGAISATSFAGAGSGLTSLNASNLSSGTVPGARMPAMTGGDVTSTAGSVDLTVALVGGQTAANVAAGAVLANAATSANTANAIVKRDASGNFAASVVSATGLGVGVASPNASAILEMSSTTKGFLPPRMTLAQRDAIASPVAGLIVYNTADNLLQYYDGTTWKDVDNASGGGGGGGCGGSVATIGGGHTGTQCVAAGGMPAEVVDGCLCRVTGATCPAGWTRHSNWGTTSQKSCTGAAGCGQGSCTTSLHAWFNQASETCTYTSGGTTSYIGGCSGYSSPTCTANLLEVGCK